MPVRLKITKPKIIEKKKNTSLAYQKVRRSNESVMPKKFIDEILKKLVLPDIKREEKKGEDTRVSIVIETKDGEEFRSRFIPLRELMQAKSITDRIVSDMYKGKSDKLAVDQWPDVIGLQIFIMNNPKAGGYERKNNCLFTCIRHSGFGTITDNNLTKQYMNDELVSIKKSLGIRHNDPVDVSRIPEVEEAIYKKFKVNLSINVYGDVIQPSKKQGKFRMNVKLQNGHYYTLLDNKYKRKIKAMPFNFHEAECLQRKIVIPKIGKEQVNLLDEDGKETIISIEKYRGYKAKPSTNPYVFVKTENLKKLVQDNQELSDLTEGSLDIRRYGGIRQISLFSYLQLSHRPNSKPISKVEECLLQKATKGGLYFKENKFTGECDEYDLNSFYPYLLSQYKIGFTIPLDGGEEMVEKQGQIWDSKEDTRYCMYIGFFSEENEKDLRGSFLGNRIGSRRVFTHYDLQAAFLLLGESMKFTIEKCIHYKNRVNSSQMFKHIFGYLTEMKKKCPGNGLIKMITSSLWGSLCTAVNDKFRSFPINSTPNVDDRDTSYISVSVKGDKCKVHEFDNSKPKWAYEEARLKPFLLSLGRLKLLQMMQEFEPNTVVRSITDSILVKKDTPIPSKMILGKEMGEWKKTRVFLKDGEKIKKNDL